MGIDLLAAVQQRLSLPEIHKHPQPEEYLTRERGSNMAQVALVCVAAALFKLTRTTNGCVKLLLSGKSDNWLELEEACGQNLPLVIEKVAGYGLTDGAAAEHLVREIANTCLLVIHENLTDKIGTDSVRDFMSAQRHNILSYQPKELPLGKMLNDDALDDASAVQKESLVS